MTSATLEQSRDTATPAITTDGRGTPGVLLRLEAGAVLAAAVFAYSQQGGSWLSFALLFLLPDLSLLGYLAGPRVGAAVYNVGHSHAVPATVAALGFVLGSSATVLVALIWVAHIGFDRLLGYGLKYGTGFADTHLGRIGRR